MKQRLPSYRATCPSRAPRFPVAALTFLVVTCSFAAATTASTELKIRRDPVTFTSGQLRLSGTLWRPRTEVAVPAVVLIHGSGKSTRRDLRHFAEAFAKAGVAALAYDKRGVGKSQGDPEAWQYFEFEELADDALAGATLLAGSSGIDATRIGLVGVSQGAWVAPLAAARQGSGIAFLVQISGAATTVAHDRLFERAARLTHEGFSRQQVGEATVMQRVDQEVTRSGKRWDEYVELWEQNENKAWFRRVYLGEAPAEPSHPFREWYRTVLDFDPLPHLEALDVPVLWLLGDPALDRLAPVAQTAELVRRLESQGGDHEIVVTTGADHSLRFVATSAAGKKGQPVWKEPLLDWLERHLQGERGR